MTSWRPEQYIGLCLACIFAVQLLGDQHATGARQPNVVVLLADDQGWGDLSSHGNGNLDTPQIDSLGVDGIEFDRFYVCPVCAPTRAEFLTGRYHPRGGVFGVTTGAERIDTDEVTIAESFARAGYATAAFGKWHNGTQYPYHPRGRGFGEFYGFCSGHWGRYFSPILDHNGRIVRGEGYVTDDFTGRAINFMRQNQGQPFFVYLAYCTPHSPMQVPDRWWKGFADRKLTMRHREPDRENIAHTRAALAMCENIDWNVGRVLHALDDLELAADTIVVYFSDNGPNGHRYNGQMKGRKGTTDEGGVRSPCFIRWPGKIPAGETVAHIAGAIDLLPTLCELAGVEHIGEKPLDGVSLRPLLQDVAADWPARMIFSHHRGRVSVRTPTHRLDDRGNLFDMVADPGQRVPVTNQPGLNADLQAAVARWRSEVLAELSEEARPFALGHPEFRFTHLPARDAAAHGEIARSSRHPNCSYFTNWTSLGDSISWDVDVAAAGDYQAVLYYTCRPEDVGAVVELELQGQRIRRQIDVAHDPPAEGAERDRVVRSESYVKDFRPVVLGTLRLKPGRGQLTLRAVEMPGDRVAEVRMLSLTRN